MAIDFSKLYCLDEAFERGAFRPDVPNLSRVGRETLREYHRGQRKPSQPLQLTWAEGSRLMDYTGTTAVLPIVVSKKLVDTLKEHGVSGWSTFPIELRGKAGELIDGFYGLVVTGQCGPLQLGRSRVVTRCAKSGHGEVEVKVGLFFDESTWDGSDMFTPHGTTFNFVTGRLKALMENAKLSNVKFEPLDAFERMW